jgi:3-oxoacyl-[acyl-carrier protein] reductase
MTAASTAPLRDKAAVVTGGSRGIGRAIVERLARDGARVVFNYAHSADAADDVVRGTGGAARAVPEDLTDPEAAERLMATAGEHLGGLDILVNNAATTPQPTLIAETADATYDQVMTVNARSVFLTILPQARGAWEVPP